MRRLHSATAAPLLDSEIPRDETLRIGGEIRGHTDVFCLGCVGEEGRDHAARAIFGGDGRGDSVVPAARAAARDLHDDALIDFFAVNWDVLRRGGDAEACLVTPDIGSSRRRCPWEFSKGASASTRRMPALVPSFPGRLHHHSANFLHQLCSHHRSHLGYVATRVVFDNVSGNDRLIDGMNKIDHLSGG